MNVSIKNVMKIFMPVALLFSLSQNAVGVEPSTLDVRLEKSANGNAWNIAWTPPTGRKVLGYQVSRFVLDPQSDLVGKQELVTTLPGTASKFRFVPAPFSSLASPNGKISQKLSGEIRENFQVVASVQGSGGVTEFVKGFAVGPCPDFVLVAVRGTNQNPNDINEVRPTGSVDSFASGLGSRGIFFWRQLQINLNTYFPAVPVIYQAYPDMDAVINSIKLDFKVPELWKKLLPSTKGLEIVGTIIRGGGAVTAVLPGYRNSVSQGVEHLEVKISGIKNSCPNAKIVLVGYSQGAQIVGDWIQTSPAKIDSISGAILFADPMFNNDDSKSLFPLNERSEFKDPGIMAQFFGRRSYFNTSKVQSWCWKGDMICTASALNMKRGNFHIDKSTGKDYYSALVIQAANLTTNMLRERN